MDDLEEARRLMALVSSRAPQAGPIQANTVISMAKVWAHIALAQAIREQNEILKQLIAQKGSNE